MQWESCKFCTNCTLRAGMFSNYHLCCHITLSLSILLYPALYPTIVLWKQEVTFSILFLIVSDLLQSTVDRKRYLNRKSCSYIAIDVMFITLDILMMTIIILFNWCCCNQHNCCGHNKILVLAFTTPLTNFNQEIFMYFVLLLRYPQIFASVPVICTTTL